METNPGVILRWASMLGAVPVAEGRARRDPGRAGSAYLDGASTTRWFTFAVDSLDAAFDTDKRLRRSTAPAGCPVRYISPGDDGERDCTTVSRTLLVSCIVGVSFCIIFCIFHSC